MYIYIHIHIYIHIYIITNIHYFVLHCIPLHEVTSFYVMLHYIAFTYYKILQRIANYQLMISLRRITKVMPWIACLCSYRSEPKKSGGWTVEHLSMLGWYGNFSVGILCREFIKINNPLVIGLRPHWSLQVNFQGTEAPASHSGNAGFTKAPEKKRGGQRGEV